MSQLIENNVPVVAQGGFNTDKAAVFGSTIAVTGAATFSSTVSGASLSTTGGVVAESGTAVPASAGAVAAGAPITMFSSGPSIYVTSDAPAFSAVKGSLCLNTGGSSTSTRLYINNGTTNWVAITTAS